VTGNDALRVGEYGIRKAPLGDGGRDTRDVRLVMQARIDRARDQRIERDEGDLPSRTKLPRYSPPLRRS